MRIKKKGIPIVVVDPARATVQRHALPTSGSRFNRQPIALAGNMMYTSSRKPRGQGVHRGAKASMTSKQWSEVCRCHEYPRGVPQETVKGLPASMPAPRTRSSSTASASPNSPPGPTMSVPWSNLSLLTGNIGARSGGQPLRGQNNVRCLRYGRAYPNVFAGYQAVAVHENRHPNMRKAWHLKEGSLP